MDRIIVYPGQILPETTLLQMAKDSLVGVAKLSEAMLGTGTQVSGLACTPLATPALGVNIAAGQIYAAGATDASAYSSLPADTHSIVKQGILADAFVLSGFSAPSGTGQAKNVLVQATYAEPDGGATVLPYFNASNPAQAWTGPYNDNSLQYTRRLGQCVVSLVDGIANSAGSQLTPSPSAGAVGLWVVTLHSNQTTITSADISLCPGAPFLATTLGQAAPLASPALTGTPTAPTAPQFDNSSTLATTAFTLGNSGRVAGVISISASTTLTLAQLGSLVTCGGSGGITLTLPGAAPAGSGLRIVNGSGGTVTVTTSGSDVLHYGPTSTTAATLAPGDTLEPYADGSGNWYAANSTLLVSDGLTGQVTHYFGSAAPLGWVARDGKTIGNNGSGATSRANGDTLALYTLIWTGTDNTTDSGSFHIQDNTGTATTRGSSAAADFTAGKRLPLPDDRGLFDRGLDTTGTVDPDNSTLAVKETDAIQNHTHANANAAVENSAHAVGSGSSADVTSANTGTMASGRSATETRPKNRAYLPIIKL